MLYHIVTINALLNQIHPLSVLTEVLVCFTLRPFLVTANAPYNKGRGGYYSVCGMMETETKQTLRDN